MSSKYSCARFVAIFSLTLVALPTASIFADALGSLETYSHWVDVTNQGSVGSWTKVDSPNPVVDQGELVVAPAHGSLAPRSGAGFLDLRTESRWYLSDDKLGQQQRRCNRIGWNELVG